MNRNLQSQTKLTEFAPLTPEEEDGSVISNFFSRFFKSKSGESNQKAVTTNEDVPNSPEEDWKNDKLKEDKDMNNEFPINIKEIRSLPNVRKRISSLLALKNSGKQSYNVTDLKQYWMPDSVSKACYSCEEKFTTFRRRHHCRVCGQIFCSRCCNQEIPGKIMNCTRDLRVCGWCGRAVLSVLQSASADDGSELSDDLLQLMEELQEKFGDVNDPSHYNLGDQGRGSLATPDREESRRKPSVGYQEERFGNARPESSGRSNLRNLLDEAVSSGGLICTSHRYRLRTYHSCFPAIQLVDWLVSQNKAGNRVQAVALGQALVKSGHIECVSFDTHTFADNNLLYKIIPSEIVTEELLDNNIDTDSDYLFERKKSVHSNFNHDLEENYSAHLSNPFDSQEISDNSNDSSTETGVKIVEEVKSLSRNNLSFTNWSTVDFSLLSDDQRVALESLRNAFSQHCGNYLQQLLNSEAIPQSWADIISPLALKVVDATHPEKAKSWTEAMDIRQYIQVKKMSGGDRQECKIINGVVCSKNLTHKAMAKEMSDPQILLLASAIMYQRVEGKYLSLEPVIMQENDYVQRTVSKIVDLGPNLVIVGKSVTRLAQEQLLDKGISLVLNAKPSLLDRLSRLTGADILSSVDAHLGSPKLGTCKLFRLQTFITEHGFSRGGLFESVAGIFRINYENNMHPWLGPQGAPRHLKSRSSDKQKLTIPHPTLPPDVS